MSKSAKLVSLSVLVTLLFLTAYGFYGRSVVNPRVLAELQTNPQGERAAIAMQIMLPDGKQLPVNYLREGNIVYMGVDGFWWRQLLSNDAPVSLLIKGQVLTGRASVVLDDPEYTRAIFRRLRPKVPEWLPDWLNGKLVVIHLDASVELSR